MREKPIILVVDDVPDNLTIVQLRLESQGYEVITAGDGEEALESVHKRKPDLVLLDIMMPKLDGIETVKRLKGDPSLPFIPVIMLTAKANQMDVVAGLEAGGDDYLTKPIEHGALVARVRAMLRIKTLHDTVRRQAGELAEWNRTLEHRVAQQLREINRVSRLKRFLAPQVADLITSEGEADLIKSHRREIVVLFCDMRGFTAFAETSEPEEVMAVLSAYHKVLGPLIHTFEGTLERFTGDGVLVFFNDPVPCAEPALRAVRLAAAMREKVSKLVKSWKITGHQIGFGIGIAQGYATLGPIGFEDRLDYAAIGTVTNVAARLCAEAAHGQILVSRRVSAAVDTFFQMEALGPLALKGISRELEVFNVGELIP